MKGVKSNGFLPIIAQAIAEMEELLGEFTSIDEIIWLNWDAEQAFHERNCVV